MNIQRFLFFFLLWRNQTSIKQVRASMNFWFLYTWNHLTRYWFEYFTMDGRRNGNRLLIKYSVYFDRTVLLKDVAKVPHLNFLHLCLYMCVCSINTIKWICFFRNGSSFIAVTHFFICLPVLLCSLLIAELVLVRDIFGSGTLKPAHPEKL